MLGTKVYNKGYQFAVVAPEGLVVKHYDTTQVLVQAIRVGISSHPDKGVVVTFTGEGLALKKDGTPGKAHRVGIQVFPSVLPPPFLKDVLRTLRDRIEDDALDYSDYFAKINLSKET